MISVVIPVYNAEKTIARCIDSVLPALGAEDELILINDGSRDATATICEDYTKKSTRLRLFSQENQGPSVARNLAVDKAVNPYVCFVDGDDAVDATAFCAFLDIAREGNQETDIWFNDFIMMTPQGQICRESSDITPSSTPSYGKGALEKYLSGVGTYANVWRCIFRREFLQERNLRFAEGVHCGEDLLFMTQAIIESKTVAFYHLPYYHYLVEQGESLSHNRSLKRVTDFLESFDACYSIAQTGDIGKLLQSKLLQELMMLLPQLPELNKEVRDAGNSAFLFRAPCLNQSQDSIHRLMYVAVRLLGVSLVSHGLCWIKQWKRQKHGLPKKMEGLR